MHVAGLWRYPVKSLAGEALTTAHITGDGISGDRVVHVAGPHGPITGRTRHGLLTVPADTGPDGIPRVAGHPWDAPEAAQAVRAVAGPHARLAAYRGPERFDILNLLVATDGAVAELGADVRRLRPNLLIGDVPADTEDQWPGQALVIGEAVIGIHSVRQRCIVTSIDPDTGVQGLAVFRRIRHRFGNQLALNAWVIRPGIIRLGDPVSCRPTTAQPKHAGGWILGARYHTTDNDRSLPDPRTERLLDDRSPAAAAVHPADRAARGPGRRGRVEHTANTSRCASSTKAATRPASGGVATATSYGSSTTPG